MPSQPRPKALLFDIGGVCVVSPFQAILDYEIANKIPTGYVNYSISRKSPNGSWHQIERGEVPLDEAWYAHFKLDLEDPASWKAYHAKQFGETKEVPPVPDIDAEYLFMQMMGTARSPDPYMFPALSKLKASGQFTMGALTNNVKFPEGHPFNKPNSDREDLESKFHVFISSAHVGLRKPERKIYELALSELDRFNRESGGDGVKAGDVVFIDDIGENLKAAKGLGMRTIKVWLGKIKNAVKELEGATGISLLEEEEKARL
jgi:epoxide hydrolase-like predicted phosphatase